MQNINGRFPPWCGGGVLGFPCVFFYLVIYLSFMFLSSDSLSLSVSLPVGLFSDFDACFKLFKPDFGGFKLYFDNFVYILGKIYEISTKNPRFKNLDKVPISSTILMHELGRHYRKYLDYLILHGFVETDNYYIDLDTKLMIPYEASRICLQ
jgi:hypothetical protein